MATADRQALHQGLVGALRSGVVPATGCTEPVSVALAAARARAALCRDVERLAVRVSPNVMKNGMAVVIPGADASGLDLAAALGAVAGDHTRGLEVLDGIGPDDLAAARALLQRDAVLVSVAETPHVLMAEVVASAASHRARVEVVGSHTGIVLVERDGEVLEEHPRPDPGASSAEQRLLQRVTLRELYDFALAVDLDEVACVARAKQLNMALARLGLEGRHGLALGASIARGQRLGLTADDLSTRMVSWTAAASDARMGGAALPAMTNAGSGNQGITATVPVCLAAEHVGAGEQAELRALVLSHLVALRVHAALPVLSAFCAAATAAMGAAAGVSLLLDGSYQAVERAVVSMAGDSVGMVCDGAGCSCTMKVATAVGSAGHCVLLALGGQRVPGTNGLVHDDVDATIRGIGQLVEEGLGELDPAVLRAMLGKA